MAGMSGEKSSTPQKAPWWGWLLFIFTIVIILGILLGGSMSRHPSKSDHGRHIREAKKWGYALFNFENDFGDYPSEETAKELREKFPEQANLLNTETSNDLMMQLVVAGYMDGPVFPDVDRNRAMELLNSDEFPFAYVSGLNSSYDSAVPLLISPLEKGNMVVDEEYAKKRYNKRIVVIRIDMSVTDQRFDENFFDVSQEHWRGKKPKVYWPRR